MKSCRRYEDAGGFAGTGFEADDEIDVAVEGGKKVQEAFHGKAGELVVAEGGDFGLIDAQGAGDGERKSSTQRSKGHREPRGKIKTRTLLKTKRVRHPRWSLG